MKKTAFVLLLLVLGTGCASMNTPRGPASLGPAEISETELVRCSGNLDENDQPVKPEDFLSLKVRKVDGQVDRYFLSVRYAYPGHDRSDIEIPRLQKIVATDEFTEDLTATHWRGVYAFGDGTAENPIEFTLKNISRRDPASEKPSIEHRVVVVDFAEKAFPGFRPRFNKSCEVMGDLP